MTYCVNMVHSQLLFSLILVIRFSKVYSKILCSSFIMVSALLRKPLFYLPVIFMVGQL